MKISSILSRKLYANRDIERELEVDSRSNDVILFCLFSIKMREFYLQIDAKKKKSRVSNEKRGRNPLNLVHRKTGGRNPLERRSENQR